MRLAKPAHEISLGQVVRDMESDFEIVACFGQSESCALEGSCKLAHVIGDALEQFLAHLDGFTLQDVLPGAQTRRKSKPQTAIVTLSR